jgi:phage protein D
MTPTFTTVLSEARRPEYRDFYVPVFELKIDGSNLPKDLLRDIVELSYTDSITEIDQFQITVNNWDAKERKFKYIGSETTADLKDPTSLATLFDPCQKKAQLSLGYAGRKLPVMIGNFTTMEPNFPSGRPPTLTVRGLNVLHRLRRKPYSTAWVKRKPSWIARNIATLRDDKGQPRFPIKIDTDKSAEKGEPELDFVAQVNQTDVDFLLNLGRQQGYELWVRTDDNRQEHLMFGPGRQARTPVNYQLDWGRTLVDFKPSLTTHNQWKSVTVRGWDRRAQRPIVATVDFNDAKLKKMNQDLQHMVVQCDQRDAEIVDQAVFTRAEALERARAILRDRFATIIKASGTTIGLPELRAGTQVLIQGLGERLNRTYLVTKTTHTIGDGGYTTRFECRAEDFTKSAQ